MATVQEDGSKVLRVRDAVDAEWRQIAAWAQEETGGAYRCTNTQH